MMTYPKPIDDAARQGDAGGQRPAGAGRVRRRDLRRGRLRRPASAGPGRARL